MAKTPSETPFPAAPSGFPFTVAERVRYGDLDTQDHANNNAFGIYFESGRVALFRAVDRAGNAPGTHLVMARLTIDYLAELLYGQDITVCVGFARLGTTSLTTRAALFVGDRCHARSEATAVLIDAATRRPTPLPEALRAACAPYVLP